jgi:hypothetical protein
MDKQTDDNTFLDIQTRLSDKKKREISDCLNDTLTNPCGQRFAKTTLPSNTENISNVGRTEKNSSDINTTDVDFLFADTDLTLIFNCKIYPLQMFQVTPFRVFSLCQYIWTASWRLITEMWRCQPYPIIIVLFISIFIQNDGCDSNIFILLHFYTIVTVVFVS